MKISCLVLFVASAYWTEGVNAWSESASWKSTGPPIDRCGPLQTFIGTSNLSDQRRLWWNDFELTKKISSTELDECKSVEPQRDPSTGPCFYMTWPINFILNVLFFWKPFAQHATLKWVQLLDQQVVSNWIEMNGQGSSTQSVHLTGTNAWIYQLC